MAKKIIVFVLVSIMMLSLCAFSASAREDYDILKGTPTIDGVIDSIFLQSWHYTITPRGENDSVCWYSGSIPNWSAEEGKSATLYVLWDDYKIYFAIEVVDSELNDCPEPVWSPYSSDSCSVWFMQDGDNYNNKNLKQCNIDYTGMHPWAWWDEGSDALAASNHAVTQTSTGYIAEWGIPYNPDYAWGEGEIFNVSLQINDLDASGETYCYGQQEWINALVLSGESVVYPEINDNTDGDSATDTITEKGTAKEETAAETADMTILASVVAIIAAAGVTVVSKRKR